MSANISGYKPDLSGEIYSYHQDLALSTTLARLYNDRTYTVDVVVHFIASPADADGERSFEFKGAELEFPDVDEEPPTDAEMEMLYRRFLKDTGRLTEAADRGDY